MDDRVTVEDVREFVSDEEPEPMALDEFLDLVYEDPSVASSSARYLLDAIEYYGTRTTVEHGEEVERYRFFDDPENDGEHAILGHTETLNDFVKDLRQQAQGDANEEMMYWFVGPTATGKSELRRCIVNGLREYSRTEEGRRYTVEWTNSTDAPGGGMTYGDDGTAGMSRWFQSPVQSNPLSVLPDDVREEIVTEAGVQDADTVSNTGPDPFSEEAMNLIEDDVYGDSHLRVVPYTVDVGQGIGLLHSEDSGRPRQKLVGQWMTEMLKELDSRGRRNPQAFSYDGVLSQGNAGVSIVEDAIHHADMVTKMLNVVDDDVAKLDRRIRMPIDTVYLLLSNYDFREELERHPDSDAIMRRVRSYSSRYLLTLSNEIQLLRRLIGNEYEIWEDPSEEQLRRPLYVNGTEIAPHTLYAVAMFEIVSRISDPSLPPVDTAIFYDKGEVESGGEEHTMDDRDNILSSVEGVSGIPCTYTHSIIANLITEEDCIMATDVLEVMNDKLHTSPVIDADIRNRAQGRLGDVVDHVIDKYKQDVLESMLRDEKPSEEDVEEYVEHVYCWGTDEDTVDPDPLTMKVFETRYTEFGEDDYSGTDPSDTVEEFRREKIIEGISTWIYHNSDGWDPEGGLPLTEIPVIEEMLDEYSWEDVDRVYEDWDPNQWDDPLDGTETKSLKEKTVENMVDLFDYSEESAKRAASIVVDQKVINDDDPYIDYEDYRSLVEEHTYGN